MNDDRRDTAYHEAGHAVYAEYFGVPVVEVSIVPDASRAQAGHTKLDHENGPPGPGSEFAEGFTEYMEHQLSIDLAGAVAAELAGGLPAAEHFGSDESGTWGDFAGPFSAADILMHLHPEAYDPVAEEYTFDEIVKQHCERTAEILKRCWPAVEAIAELLLERETITGDQVRQIMSELRS